MDDEPKSARDLTDLIAKGDGRMTFEQQCDHCTPEAWMTTPAPGEVEYHVVHEDHCPRSS
jgi:hypothetical protein